MEALKFKYKRLGLTYSLPIDEEKKLKNERNLVKILGPYLEEINKSGAYILVTVLRDGQTFKNEIVGSNNSVKYVEFGLQQKIATR